MGGYVKAEAGVRLYVEDVNPQGRPALFLHGWPFDHRIFEYQFDELCPTGVRCIAWDQRGFGQSDKPGDGYTYDRLADDLREVVNTLNLQNFTLVAHSSGGAVAARYMSRHRGYGVAKLALMDAALPGFVACDTFPHGCTKGELGALIEEAYSDRPAMLEKLTDRLFYRRVSEPMRRWLFTLGLSACGWGTVGLLRAMGEESLTGDLADIAVPTLILHGRHDAFCPYILGETQQRRIPGSALLTFEESGHCPMLEQRQKCNMALQNFI